MDFWEGETCEYCEGKIVDRRVTLHRKVEGRYMIIEECQQACVSDAAHITMLLMCLRPSMRSLMVGGKQIEKSLFQCIRSEPMNPLIRLYPLPPSPHHAGKGTTHLRAAGF